jgi:hypothetical protein
MVVASGQLPYMYDGDLPVHQKRGGWPGVEVPNIGPSGDLFEQGMFVLNAEQRKWHLLNLGTQTYLAFWNPNIPAGSGFEPKMNGETFIGHVGRPALLAIDNIIQMRDNVDTLFSRYADDTNYTSSQFMESWLSNAYPESPSGHREFVYDSINDLYFIQDAIWLRPSLDDFTAGDFMLDMDIHWLGGSGTLFDVDYGEVLFNPFPFPRKAFFFAPASQTTSLSFGPLYPLLQTTAGTLPSVLASRYASDIAAGTFKAETNFEAIQSGYLQLDGYAIFPGTLIRLTTGNNSNFYSDIGVASDFTFFGSGARKVHDGDGYADGSARVYISPTPQSSGMYRLSLANVKSNVPFSSIPSGYVSFFPGGDLWPAAISDNVMMDRSIAITSDGGLKITPAASKGYHVMDDALWITGPNASALSGNFNTKGLYIVSPHTGECIWYRPAERIVATSGNKPGGTAPLGSPGIFGVHVGMENFGANFMRISRVWQENITAGSPNIFDNTIYFQKYSQPDLNYSEQSVSWTISNNAGGIGNSIDGMNFDGTNYWIWYEGGTVHRFNGSLVYTGSFTGNIARRRHYANGQKLYTIAGNVTVGDPILAMSPAGGSISGIGVWSISSEPANILTDVGTYSHDSAKRLRAETHFGDRSTAVIHAIRDVSGSTHVPNGVWMIIQFNNLIPFNPDELFLCKIREDATEWVVEKSFNLRIIPGILSLPAVPTDFPYEFILHDID